MRFVRTLLLVAFFGSAGCGAAFTMNPPDDYLELESDYSGYSYRATSAEGVRLAVREMDNDGHGSRPFWEQAVRNQLRFNGGYAITEEVEVHAASGHVGRLYRCGKDDSSRTYDYWVALFVTDDHVFVVEAGGLRAQFEPDRADLDAAIAGFRID